MATEKQHETAERAVRAALRQAAAASPLPADFTRQLVDQLPPRAAGRLAGGLWRLLAASLALVAFAVLGVAAVGSLRLVLPLGSDATPSATLRVVGQPSASPSTIPEPSPSPVPKPSPSPALAPTATPMALPTWTPPPGPPTMLPENVDPPDLVTKEAKDQIAAEIIERLLAAYAGPPDALEEAFTPQALADAVATDELLAAIWKGERRVLMEHELVWAIENDATRYMPDGRPVRMSVDIRVDVQAGARLVDPNNAVLREFRQPQRLLFELTGAWDGLHARWQVDELRSPALGVAVHLPGGTPSAAPPCPWRPVDISPVEGFDSSTDRAWCDALGREVPTTHLSFVGEGTSHCGWQAAALLWLGPEPGWEIDIYDERNFVRDPTGLFEDDWLSRYGVLAALPDDAVDTGLSNGNVRLYYVPAQYGTAIYAEMGGVVERWPRLAEGAGCA